MCVIGDVAIGRLELSCLDHPFGRSEDDDDDDFSFCVFISSLNHKK